MAHAIPDLEDLGNHYAKVFPQCSCNKCITGCKKIPGIYDPDHLWQMLTSQTMSKENFLNDNLLDYVIGDNIIDSYMYIRPRTIAEKGKQNASIMPKVGKCIHLGPKGCTLARNAMPIECISSYNCSINGPFVYGKLYGSNTWLDHKGKTLIKLFTRWAMDKGVINVGYESLMHQLNNTEEEFNVETLIDTFNLLMHND